VCPPRRPQTPDPGILAGTYPGLHSCPGRGLEFSPGFLAFLLHFYFPLLHGVGLLSRCRDLQAFAKGTSRNLELSVSGPYPGVTGDAFCRGDKSSASSPSHVAFHKNPTYLDEPSTPLSYRGFLLQVSAKQSPPFSSVALCFWSPLFRVL